jgi:hypothetical protein
MGLPFFGNQIAGDLLTVGILFGGLRIAERPAQPAFHGHT